MAQGRTLEHETGSEAVTVESVAEATGFGAEFRELARQRRFVRSDEPVQDTAPPISEAPEWRSAQPVAPSAQRMSTDERAAIIELARMSERLVEARESLAAMTVRADRADADITAAQIRMVAARALMQDAQRATRMAAERCAWFEGRCESLQEALDLAVNASWLTRWRWRRRELHHRNDG